MCECTGSREVILPVPQRSLLWIWENDISLIFNNMVKSNICRRIQNLKHFILSRFRASKRSDKNRLLKKLERSFRKKRDKVSNYFVPSQKVKADLTDISQNVTDNTNMKYNASSPKTWSQDCSYGSNTDVSTVNLDVVSKFGKYTLIYGWTCSPDVSLAVLQNEIVVDSKIIRFPREDIAKNLRLSENIECGFIICTEEYPPENLTLVWLNDGVKQSKTISSDVVPLKRGHPLLIKHYHHLAEILPEFSVEWLMAQTHRPCLDGGGQGAAGFLDHVWHVANMTLACGWCHLEEEGIAWLETQDGQCHDLSEACWVFRSDLAFPAKNTIASEGHKCAFMMAINGSHILQLKAWSCGQIRLLHCPIPISYRDRNPNEQAAMALGVFAQLDTSGNADERHLRFDRPVISSLIDQKNHLSKFVEGTRHVFGAVHADPEVSIIIPLYGHLDFIDLQLCEFAHDPTLLANAEIIYVLDDPKLGIAMSVLAPTLYKIHQVPFVWIDGVINRGYSGANNLGVGFSRGKYLAFLNSDVFPKAPDWLYQLIQELDQNPRLGVVSPRLLFPDGGQQHSGMQFRWSDEFQVWLNFHPGAGLPVDPEKPKCLITCSAVTGAAMVIRRDTFVQVGGWDTEYLIGDFEDSDLCLAVQALGLVVGCQTRVEMFHLERQSFNGIGDAGFRQRVALYNARRHQTKWHDWIVRDRS